VADYPFTTLTPNLGVLQADKVRWSRAGPVRVTVADMPGIIKGAHEGRGLGLWFLRHIERTRMLVFVLDAGDRHVKRDYNELVAEIESYNPAILRRPSVVAVNKVDLVGGRPPRAKFGVPTVMVSAMTGQGVDELREIIDRSFAGPD
jgi:GTP-binding protein